MKKAISLILAAAILLGLAASSAETVKHERVFVVIGADGETESLTDSVRLENRDKLDELRDSTMLAGIQNVGGHETFTLDGTDLVWQAAGKDITYQGTSDRALPVKPVISVTLDGAAASAKDLASRAGRAEITVRYDQPQAVPHLAVTLLLLPETGISGVETDNAFLVSFSGRLAVLGWAVPGADPDLKLPDSFSVRFDADHADVGWMMTFASADPLEAVCREISGRLPAGTDPVKAADDIVAILTSLKNGEALPQTSNMIVNMVIAQVNTLNSSLSTLSGSSGSLNDGAGAVFAALLDASGRRLAAALEPLGKAAPLLTADNYGSELNGIMTQLDSSDPNEKKALEELQSILEQLDQARDYVREVKTYTNGVDQVCSTVSSSEQLAATALLPFAETDLRGAAGLFESTRESVSGNAGYDLRPEGMETVTVYIIRSDLQ